MRRLLHGVRSFAGIEPGAGRIFVSRIKSQETAQVHQKPEVEIGHALFHTVQRPDTLPHEIEQLAVRLALLDKTVQNLCHEQGDRRAPHVERHSLQDDSALHLPKTVHLLPRRGQPFEFEGEHRLEQRQFRTPSPTAADTLHHVTLTPQRVGQQVHDHRAVAILERIEHDSPRLVCLERSRHLTLSLRAPSPSRRAYALRPDPGRRPEPVLR